MLTSSCRNIDKLDQDTYSTEKKDLIQAWDGASNSLSRILQTVDDVNYRVVDIPKNHKRRKKVHTFDDVVDLRGDTKIKIVVFRLSQIFLYLFRSNIVSQFIICSLCPRDRYHFILRRAVSKYKRLYLL